MTPRENLLAVLRHGQPEWIPIVGHVDPYNQPAREGMDPALAARLAKVQWSDESTVWFSRYLGLDIADWYGPPLRCVPGAAVTVETRQEGDDSITLWHTPAGDLRQVSRRCRADGTSYLVEHRLKSPADLPALAFLYESERVEVDPARLPALQQRRDLIGENGIVMFSLPGTPLGMLIRVEAGVETTTYLAADAPDALRDLFRVMEENHLRRFRLAASLAADALVGVDDTSTTTQSPAMFAEFCVDYTNHVADVAHAAGTVYLHHSCGLIRGLVDLYRQTRMDGVHAFQLPPMGDIAVGEGRQRLGPKITIWASLTPLLDEPPENWDYVRRSIREAFEGAAPGDHFLLGLAAMPNRTMEETARLLGEARKYQSSVSSGQ